MSQPMPTWLILAAAGAISITALLTFALYRLNSGPDGAAATAARRKRQSEEFGPTIYFDGGGGSRSKADADGNGSDGGGGDGGGGGGGD